MLRQNDLGAGKRVEPSPEMFGDLFDRAFAFDGSGKHRSHHRHYVPPSVLHFADPSLQPPLPFPQDFPGLLAVLVSLSHPCSFSFASLFISSLHCLIAPSSSPSPLLLL